MQVGNLRPSRLKYSPFFLFLFVGYYPYGEGVRVERVDGIEPTSSAWKAVVIAVILYPHLTQTSGDWSMVATIQLVTLSALTLTHLPAMDYMVWLPSCPVFGSGGWARTSDPMINSHLLYQLSYAELWCSHTDSNRGPADYKSAALPTEL